LVKVEAFGLNRSELHTRLGMADGVTFPRVLGIEAAGVVAACPGGEFEIGSQVAALMGGMGRTFDGGYAEYTCVPVRQIVPFSTDLDWATVGAVPEMLQTSHGSLTIGLDAQPGQSILIRGGTSSIGMARTVPTWKPDSPRGSSSSCPEPWRACVLSPSNNLERGTPFSDVPLRAVRIPRNRARYPWRMAPLVDQAIRSKRYANGVLV
jgi:Zn-dependent alcohol dehydrogenase